ncbi:MAG TPA: NAD(P)H-dependent dehydrogenase/reductase [Nitrospirae bacterium]|nr:NAD(P)H-dependent dehydrogenase/reductase [Nitrospirota bacterium]
MFIDLLRKRRSIRRYEDRPVERDKLDLIIEAALRSPSSRSLNPWEFVVVTDREVLERLSRAKEHGSSFLKNAPLGIVVCADPERCDVWVEDCSIASIIIQLTAHDLGLGSCWIQIRGRMHNATRTAEEYVKEVLGIPEKMVVESIIAIGYPAEEKPPHPVESLQWEKVSFEVYGKKRDVT